MAHCIVSLYRSVSSSEKTPPGRSSCCESASAMMSRWVNGGVRSKVLSRLFNPGCNETYTLFREWDGSAGASRLFVG